MKAILIFLLTIAIIGCNNPQDPNDNNNLPSKIAFAKSDSLGTKIFTVNPDGSNFDTLFSFPVSPGLPVGNLSWSPDAFKISILYGDSIAVLDIENSETAIFNYVTPDVQGYSWFPDSRNIAISASGVIYKVDIYTNQSEKITEGVHPEISPNGELIAYRNNGAIYVLDLKNGSTQYIADSQYGIAQWSPTSDRLAFVGGEHNNELLSVPIDGNEKMLLFSGDVVTAYKWSPDGEKIAYGKAYGFGVVNIDESKDEIVSLMNSYSPSWSPENSSIVYLLLGLDEQSIYVYNLMNKSNKLLLSLNSGALNVSWSPR